MNCRRARRLLERGGARRDLREHLAACPECAALAERWAAAETALAGFRSTATPPPGFTGRVRGALPPPEDLMGWAALRLLPATLALVLLLSWLNLRAGEEAASEQDPADSVLSWVLDPSSSAGGDS